MNLFKYLLLLVSTLFISQRVAAQRVITFDDPHLHYMGRVDMQKSAAVLSWPGSSVKINFMGTSIAFTLKDEAGDNYYNEVLDGKVIGIYHVKSDKEITTPITGLAPGNHTFELFKRTEWTMGSTWFYNFIIPRDGAMYPASPEKKAEDRILRQ